MREFVIAVAQAASFPGQTDMNLQLLQQLAHESKRRNADLLCLPEAFLTGYDRHLASDIALDANDPHIVAAEELAWETGVALSYGFIERNQVSHSDASSHMTPNANRPFVTHVVTDGTKRLVYRKTHLGPHEQDFFTAGNHLPVETIADVRMGVHLCWEAHIPQIAATLRQRGAELLIAPFASGLGGQRRRDAWMRVLPARANDNGCYLAACNALRPKGAEIGNDSLTGGGAIVFDPKGVVMAECFSSENALVVAALPGPLPRETNKERMGALSYFDHRRPELYV